MFEGVGVRPVGASRAVDHAFLASRHPGGVLRVEGSGIVVREQEAPARRFTSHSRNMRMLHVAFLNL